MKAARRVGAPTTALPEEVIGEARKVVRDAIEALGYDSPDALADVARVKRTKPEPGVAQSPFLQKRELRTQLRGFLDQSQSRSAKKVLDALAIVLSAPVNGDLSSAAERWKRANLSHGCGTLIDDMRGRYVRNVARIDPNDDPRLFLLVSHVLDLAERFVGCLDAAEALRRGDTPRSRAVRAYLRAIVDGRIGEPRSVRSPRKHPMEPVTFTVEYDAVRLLDPVVRRDFSELRPALREMLDDRRGLSLTDAFMRVRAETLALEKDARRLAIELDEATCGVLSAGG
jgi:hypothetical protein